MSSVPEAPSTVPRESRLPFLALALLAILLLAARISSVKIGSSARSSLLPEHPHASTVASVFGLLVLSAVGIGLFVVLDFMIHRARYLRDSRPPRLSAGSLVVGFLGYLIAFQIIEIFLLGFLNLESSVTAVVVWMALTCCAMVVSLGYGLSLVPRRDDAGLSEIGLRLTSAVDALRWGAGGYVAAIPLVFGSAALSAWLMGRYGIVTPDHPLVPLLGKGGWVLPLAIVMGVVFAPIVEEIAFRGLLFGGLRGVMGFWWAALSSSLLFALVHPTFPGQFLPLALLGMVLAVLRQSTGSLAPCIVCHALNNAVALLGAILHFSR